MNESQSKFIILKLIVGDIMISNGWPNSEYFQNHNLISREGNNKNQNININSGTNSSIIDQKQVSQNKYQLLNQNSDLS